MLTAGVKYARPTMLEVRPNTGSARSSIAYQLSHEDDEADWGTTTELSAAYVSTEGFTYESSFTDVSSAFAAKRLVRWGLNCKDTGAVSTVELLLAAFAIDLREA